MGATGPPRPFPFLDKRTCGFSFAEVYRAEDLRLGQEVALKFLSPVWEADPTMRERFLDEVRLARRVSHAHVCRVYDVGEVDGRLFLSMENVEGENLKTLLKRVGRLPRERGAFAEPPEEPRRGLSPRQP